MIIQSVIGMVRKRIIVRGNVQGVGYRVIVKRLAQALGVNGVVRNLKDRSVEIYCEADGPILEVFLKGLDIKRKDDNMLSVHVDSIETFDDGTKGYDIGKAPKRFELMDIDYGRRLSFVERESLERQELLILGGSQIQDTIGDMHKDLHNSIGDMHSDLHNDLSAVRGDFQTLDEKYGSISASIASIDKNFSELIKIIKEQDERHD